MKVCGVISSKYIIQSWARQIIETMYDMNSWIHLLKYLGYDYAIPNWKYAIPNRKYINAKHMMSK